MVELGGLGKGRRELLDKLAPGRHFELSEESLANHRMVNELHEAHRQKMEEATPMYKDGHVGKFAGYTAYKSTLRPVYEISSGQKFLVSNNYLGVDSEISEGIIDLD